MHVEKTINDPELSLIVRKHFEKELGQPLDKFSLKKVDGGYAISYDTDLIQPTAIDKAKETAAAAVSGLKSIFGR